MADLNLAQIYSANPRTSLNTTDLIYLSVNATDDGSIQAQNLFNTTNLQLSSGKINTIQNINTTATPQFSGLGIGTAASANYTVLVNSAAGQAYYSQYWFGTVSKPGFDVWGLSYEANLTPDNNTHDATILHIRPTYTLTNDAKNIYGIRFRPYIGGGSATNGYSVYIDNLDNIGGGSTTNYYGLYVAQPTIGTSLNKCATFLGGLTVGSSYAAIAAPANGMAVEGNVTIGNSASNGAKLNIANGAYDPVNYGRGIQICNLSGNRQSISFIRSTFNALSMGFLGASSIFGFGLSTVTDSDFDPELISIDLVNLSVGIGTSAPSSKLSVHGNISVGENFSAISAPTNGMIVEGKVGFGTSSANADANVTFTTASAVSIFLSGVQTQTNANPDQHGIFVLNTFSPTSGASGIFGINCSPTVIAPSAQTISKFSAIETFPILNSNVGTITSAYGVFVGSGTAGSGTITNFTNLLVAMPTAATNNICAAFAGGIAIGSNYITTIPPTNGAIIEGKVAIGVNAPAAETYIHIDAETAYSVFVGGVQTEVDSFNDEYGIWVGTQYSPTSGAADVSSIYLSPNFGAPSGQTITRAHGLHIYNQFSTNVGTIGVAYGMRIESGSTSSGTVSLSYGLHVARPAHGSASYTAYFEETVGIGTASPEASAALDVQSTTKGLKIPSLTTAQKNAISSPVEGLIVYDSTLHKMCVRVSGAWETVTSS